MPTDNERPQNDLFYCETDESHVQGSNREINRVISYRNNLVRILKNANPDHFVDFNEDLTLDEFRNFVVEAKSLGYSIYTMTQL